VALSRGEAQGGTDLVVNAGVTASVFGLTFTGGSEHALVNHGSLTLDHVAVSDNRIGYAQQEKNGNVVVMFANGLQRQLTGEAAKKFVQAFEFLNYTV
jgi:hypothetical protein